MIDGGNTMQNVCGHREHGISNKIKPIGEEHREGKGGWKVGERRLKGGLGSNLRFCVGFWCFSQEQ